MNMPAPIRFGLTGLGGYSSAICDRFLETQNTANSPAKLVAISDPLCDQFPEKVTRLAGMGIRVYSSFDDLLEQAIDAVWLPLPIDLHRPFTERALEAGKAVMCEKPAAGSVDDVDAMIAARDRAGLPVAIGFQDVYHAAVGDLKRRMLSGEFGRAVSVQVFGCWPRPQSYYLRNDWVGRLQRNGVWIMDSPASNAMAHFLHLPLFLLGSTLYTAAAPIEVAAELYRANRIENYDTCSYRITLPDDVLLHLVYTHACPTSVSPQITIEMEHATIRYIFGQDIEIHRDGRIEPLSVSAKPWPAMYRTVQKWLNEGNHSAIGATLETARAHTITVNAASEASPVHDVPVDQIEQLLGDDETPLLSIRNIIPAMRQATLNKCMLHETGLLGWTQPAGKADTRRYAHFAGPRLLSKVFLPQKKSADRAASSAIF
jgi:predicted dehydrogenase